MKPNKTWSHAELREYVVKHKLDKAPIPLSHSKKHMIEKLKNLGHWDDAGTGRPSPAKKRPVKTTKTVIKASPAKGHVVAGSVKARARGTHAGILPFPGFEHFAGAGDVTGQAVDVEGEKAAKQQKAAKQAKMRRKMKAMMKAKGVKMGTEWSGTYSSTAGAHHVYHPIR
jgi:hypothetical protein